MKQWRRIARASSLAVCASIALLLVASCGAFAKSPSDPQLLGAIIAFWKQRGETFGGPGTVYVLVTPTYARQANDATTTEFMGQKIGTVTVTYIFRANADFTYKCEHGFGNVLTVGPAAGQPHVTLPYAARAGTTISCPITVTYQKTDRGWLIEPVDGDGLGFNFIE